MAALNTTLTALDLGRLLRRKEVSSEEITTFYLNRIEALNPKVNAFIAVCRDRAIAAARRADKELAAGNDRGPLHGIPFAVKDQVWTEGIRTTNGSRLFSDFVPTQDATL